MNDSFLKGLNDSQKQAVERAQGASIILAGAGSGKTRVLVHKVLNLVVNHDVPPYNIIMITFTNKAASEMRERIQKSMPAAGKSPQNLGFVGTFHSLCARILRIDGDKIGLDPNFTIYDDSDSKSVVKSILKDRGISRFTPSYFASRISAAKNEMIPYSTYEQVFSDSRAAEVALVYEEYEARLAKNHAVDFDDLLLKVIELFMTQPEILAKYQHKYRYILVDEFQDTNVAQYILTRLLGQQYKNVTIVGDFSQSIYSWRGADIQNLEKFKKDFPDTKVFHLERNYRSSQEILNFAYEVISKNTSHPILKLYTDNDAGEEIVFYEADDEEDEVFFVLGEIKRLIKEAQDTSFALLYRTNAQSRVIEEAFLHEGMPYTLIGGTRFYERREIKDVLSYLRLLVNPVDTVATERIKKLGKGRWGKFRGLYEQVSPQVHEKATTDLMEQIFETTGYLQMYDVDSEEDFSRLENIKELKSVALQFPKLTEFLEQVALVESEYFEGEKRGEGQVKMMTLHQAKGAEFDVVFIMGVEDGILPHSRAITDFFQLEEERRLFYVGITRARRRLYITHAKRRFIFGNRSYAMKSRFLSDSGDFFQV